MGTSVGRKIDIIRARVQALHAESRLALSGEREFGVEQVRALSSSLLEMAPLVARSAELRIAEPDTAVQLDRYKSELRELQTTLDQIRLMLLTKCAQMQTRGGQLEAVSKWAGALRQTQ
jgi:hypothetical protein